MPSTVDQRKVPSLSLKGWVTTVPEKLDKLLSYYFLSDHSQSDWFEVFSLPYHVATKGHAPRQIKNLMENDLIRFFTRYFTVSDRDGNMGTTPTVNVTIVDTNANGIEIGRYEIQTEIIVVVDGKQYSAEKAIQVLNSKISIIDRLNNG